MTLSDAQRGVLTPALTREDRCIYPITANLKGGAVGNVAKSLLKRALLEEVPAADHSVVWRRGEDGTPLTLCITDAGARAISGDIVGPDKLEKTSVQPAFVLSDIGERKRGGAQEAIIALLKRKQGATIAEMKEATGWQPHSVRGALSGVVSKRLGHKVIGTREDRGRVYRIG